MLRPLQDLVGADFVIAGMGRVGQLLEGDAVRRQDIVPLDSELRTGEQSANVSLMT